MGTEIERRPECGSCGVYLELRDPSKQTYEQSWCGVWYDHPPMESGSLTIGHARSVLLPSPELLAQHAEMS